MFLVKLLLTGKKGKNEEARPEFAITVKLNAKYKIVTLLIFYHVITVNFS